MTDRYRRHRQKEPNEKTPEADVASLRQRTERLNAKRDSARADLAAA